MMMKNRLLRRVFSRQVAVTIMWLFILGTVSFVVNTAGIRITGSVQNWTSWLNNHASYFLVWRILLYIVVAYGWYWMRQRLILREPTVQAKQRIIRIECSTICALLALEVSNWLN